MNTSQGMPQKTNKKDLNYRELLFKNLFRRKTVIVVSTANYTSLEWRLVNIKYKNLQLKISKTTNTNSKKALVGSVFKNYSSLLSSATALVTSQNGLKNYPAKAFSVNKISPKVVILCIKICNKLYPSKWLTRFGASKLSYNTACLALILIKTQTAPKSLARVSYLLSKNSE